MAPHPRFNFAYAPGEVVQLSKRLPKLIIRFYDFSESLIDKNDIYRLKRPKFQHDIDSIIEFERAWIGYSCLAYNEHSKNYEWGKIIGKINYERQFVVEYPNGQQIIQTGYLIFISKTSNETLRTTLLMSLSKNVNFLDFNHNKAEINYKPSLNQIENKDEKTVNFSGYTRYISVFNFISN